MTSHAEFPDFVLPAPPPLPPASLPGSDPAHDLLRVLEPKESTLRTIAAVHSAHVRHRVVGLVDAPLRELDGDGKPTGALYRSGLRQRLDSGLPAWRELLLGEPVQ